MFDALFSSALTEGEHLELLAILEGKTLAESVLSRKVPTEQAHGDRCGLVQKAGCADLIQLQAKLLRALWDTVSSG